MVHDPPHVQNAHDLEAQGAQGAQDLEIHDPANNLQALQALQALQIAQPNNNGVPQREMRNAFQSLQNEISTRKRRLRFTCIMLFTNILFLTCAILDYKSRGDLAHLITWPVFVIGTVALWRIGVHLWMKFTGSSKFWIAIKLAYLLFIVVTGVFEKYYSAGAWIAWFISHEAAIPYTQLCYND